MPAGASVHWIRKSEIGSMAKDESHLITELPVIVSLPDSGSECFDRPAPLFRR